MSNTPGSSTEQEEDVLPDAPPPALSDDDAPPPIVKTEPAPSSPPPEFAAKAESASTSARDVKDVKTLFDDDDDDDAADDDLIGGINEADLLAAVPKKPTAGEEVDPQAQLAFYQRLFPWRPLFHWLNHSAIPSTDFGHREFAFTLAGGVYLRYQAFATVDMMRKEVLRLNPSRFEIGPVYTANPRDRKSLRKAAFKPMEKELVFDIDLTDYDDVRTCCDKANICHRCWAFITVAIKILDAALRDDLGFRHILWVYSGRRGAHAWVCDKRARVMDDTKRRAVAAYLEVVRGGNVGGKSVSLRRPLHPHVARSLAILSDGFVQHVLRDQDPWRTPAMAEKLLKLLPDKALADALRRRWAGAAERASIEKWADVNAVAKDILKSQEASKKLRESREDVVFEYYYPRLDVEVSKHLNHLLKSPFVIHPGTGRICVPIDPADPEGFDPLSVPTIGELLREVDEWKAEHVGEKKGEGEEGGAKREVKAESMEF
ncbi:hypothetical protein EDC01DRAFT_139044 [Geopyxis carbonaria]|nr:hypothetical protein EDC01DRAFT_139044 [Geopyxis carbonaria]